MGSQRIRGNLAAAALVAATAVAVFASPARAEPKPQTAEYHCVAEVTGVEDGVLVTVPDVCFKTEVEASRYAARIKPTPTGFGLFSGSGIVGTHYTSTGYGGSSITVVGTSCIGGVWYPTGSWNNNIESSRHHCGSAATRFYNSSNCATGPYAIYSQKTSLGSMNNKASCVRYG